MRKMTLDLNRQTKIFLALLSCLVFASQAIAQTAPAELIERAQKMGIPKDLKYPTDLIKTPGINLAKTTPSNFPIEIYKSNILSTSFTNSTKGAPSAGLSIKTKDSQDAVLQFYKNSLTRGGWKVQSPNQEALAKITKGKKYNVMRGQKDNQSLFLMIYDNQGEPGTSILINWFISGN